MSDVVGAFDHGVEVGASGVKERGQLVAVERVPGLVAREQRGNGASARARGGRARRRDLRARCPHVVARQERRIGVREDVRTNLVVEEADLGPDELRVHGKPRFEIETASVAFAAQYAQRGPGSFRIDVIGRDR